MRRFIALAVVTAAALLGPAGASAFVEVGNSCSAGGAISLANTAVQADEAAGNPLPLTVPSAGVITSWRINKGSALPGLSEKLKVLRGDLAGPQVIGESSLEAIAATQNVFSTRVPVQTGDRIGVFGPKGFFACTGGGGDSIAAYLGDPAVGSSAGSPEGASNLKVAISAFLEPDADGDGYGDETQDGCPTDAAVHGACPTPTPFSLDAYALGRGGTILVFASVSKSSLVSVSGSVSLPFRSKPKRMRKRGRRAAQAKVFVKLRSATQTVAAGQIGRFSLKLPGPVKSQLRRTPPGRSLTARLAVGGSDDTGQASAKSVAVKLHGWKKKHKRRK